MKKTFQSSLIDLWNTYKIECVLIVAVFSIFAIPRFLYIANSLPYYSIDENDVVEYALGYYGGSLHPSWFKYGAFYSYILSTIYFVQSLFSDGNIHQFVEGYFADPFSFFFTARFVNSLIHVSIAALIFQVGRTINLKVALWSTVLALLPFSDLLTNFTVRVDSLLAINVTVSLLFGIYYARKGNYLAFAFAGLFAGFALGSKTLPALMLFPSLYIATLLHTHKFDINHKRTEKNIFSSIFRTVFNWHNYLFLGCLILGLFLSHPYSILDFESFWGEQIYAIQADGSGPWPKGYILSRFSGTIGYPFIVSGVMATFFALYRGWHERYSALVISASYILVFWLAFATAPTRNYFYVPIIGLLCFCIIFTIYDLAQRSISLKRYLNVVLVTLLLVVGFQPLKSIVPKFASYGLSQENITSSTQKSAKEWITQNIDSNSKIMFYGYSVQLPRLYDPNPNEQAVYGEHFMYQRNENEYWKERFSSFMSSLEQYQVPVYDIVYSVNFTVNGDQKEYYLRYEMGDDERYLYPLLQQMDIEYLVTNYDVQKYAEFQQALVWSSRGKGLQGRDVYIYRVQKD